MTEQSSEEFKQLAVLDITSTAFKEFRNPSPKVQLEAIKKNPANIRYIEDPDEELQMIALRKSPAVLNHIRKLSPAILEYCIETRNWRILRRNDVDLEHKLKLIRCAPDMVHHVGKTCNRAKNEEYDRLWLEAVRQSTSTISYYKGDSIDVFLEALETIEFLDTYMVRNIVKKYRDHPRVKDAVVAYLHDGGIKYYNEINEIRHGKITPGSKLERIAIDCVRRYPARIHAITYPTTAILNAAASVNFDIIRDVKEATLDYLLDNHPERFTEYWHRFNVDEFVDHSYMVEKIYERLNLPEPNEIHAKLIRPLRIATSGDAE